MSHSLLCRVPAGVGAVAARTRNTVPFIDTASSSGGGAASEGAASAEAVAAEGQVLIAATVSGKRRKRFSTFVQELLAQEKETC